MNYTVQSGDTMNSISQRYNLDLDQLIAANPHISNPHEIHPGQEIIVPSSGSHSRHHQYRLSEPYPEIKVMGENLHYAALLHEDFAGKVSEVTAVMQYTHHQLELDMMPGLQEAAELLEGISIVEMKHLEMLGKTIILLGGAPQYNSNFQLWTPLYVSYCDFNPVLQIQEDIQGELDAIAQYHHHIRMIDDPFIQALLARIIKDEEDHVRRLTIQLNKLGQWHCPKR
ncbi:Peptidoglycan-binding lysin domain protein [Syntrophobotulus glycolicus DSM 8271]|uniref:Peptidoglycan-binding lysin domain protein n=1 Tax=Syntrophobotulus glycolicus (strain DSM 8271 / FlGlyR) TaxID=645991 RepID=F0T0G7_SYNGF|nr:LysM peptidoglycan-binding domain-containing protein [Syntrophobotulus glycolicus]ADY57339.1 Peptidoglycan-binding lysin domain protein [Syntrophobotulus glycolicus DSM 8271]